MDVKVVLSLVEGMLYLVQQLVREMKCYNRFRAVFFVMTMLGEGRRLWEGLLHHEEWEYIPW